ncbi:glycosyltransferase family 4 protein [Limosilactobacillus reuteri]|uniref:glycosyltransferase family 4 protein n=1 Tax=Limosilactobacillus reuteri TaxID=1598 RepID=UPI00129B95E2|nr:glycosyltransferase family 4 protein [Limosilactobacillus reuteri]MRG63486.1 glycosyltransferase [Limosilactobacillus reuteri]
MENILYLHAGAEMYGADKILLELVSGLNSKRFHPIVVLPEHGILEKRLKENHIETYVIPYPILRRKYFNVRGIWQYISTYYSSSKQIEKLVKKKNISLIHVNTAAVLEGIYLKKKLKVKMIWHIHEIILSPAIVGKTLNYLVGKYSDQCIAVSEAVKNNLLKSGYFESDQIDVIYNGVDSHQFTPSLDSSYLYNEWNIPKNAIKVGMIGRVNAWKGQDHFLEALTPLLNQYPNLYLFIIGSAFNGQEWRVNKLKKEISKDKNGKRIIYSEFRTDNNYIQNFLNLLVLPSTNPDPLPTVVLEAMASGTPVVGYRHGGVTEMIRNGKDGLLAEVNNPVDMRQKVEWILENNKVALFGKNARFRQENKFSIQSFISNFEAMYTKLIIS